MLVEKTTKEGLEARLEVSDDVLIKLIEMFGNVALETIKSPEYLAFCLKNQELVLPFVEKMVPAIIDIVEKGDRRARLNREREERRNDQKNYQQHAR